MRHQKIVAGAQLHKMHLGVV